jgi:hypothetical protein
MPGPRSNQPSAAGGAYVGHYPSCSGVLSLCRRRSRTHSPVGFGQTRVRHDRRQDRLASLLAGILAGSLSITETSLDIACKDFTSHWIRGIYCGTYPFSWI